MTNVGLDEILSRLTAKFNRIFYDREFVGSVREDLQAIINNKYKCCVLVFPSLSPNYLRVVRYQAKLCDLAVISLDSGSVKSIGVCHKKYLLPTTTEEDCKKEELKTPQMAENTATVTRKKRPPIQLYVPPAQRKSRLRTAPIQIQKTSSLKNTSNIANNDTSQYASTSMDKEEVNNHVPKESCLITRDTDSIECNTNRLLGDQEIIKSKDICFCTDDIGYFYNKRYFSIPYFNYQCHCVKYLIFKDIFPYARLLIFSIQRMKHSFHWIRCSQSNPNILVIDTDFRNLAVMGKGNHILKNISKTSGLFGSNTLDFMELHLSEEKQEEFQNTYCLCGNKILFNLPDYMYCCCLSVPDFEIIDDGLTPDVYLQNCRGENGPSYNEEYIRSLSNCILIPQIVKTEDIDIDRLLDNTNRTESPHMPMQEIPHCDSKTSNVSAKLEATNTKNDSTKIKTVSKHVERVIVLEERIDTQKIGPTNLSLIKNEEKQNVHEQEKEIMRKAKQNINRKTRPIIKYVDDDNDILNIGKGDNVNNWEDLFNDEGELQEDIFTEIIQKVGPEVAIVKATEDYSAFASKQQEELEHMVELYDFPATLETHDIISAFSELKSDSMYLKWVDDTHALLVLGSSTQAQKAIDLSNELIKVRPMSAASSSALKKANQSDLKPAMKRPQTNLQTARRMITSALGAKSRVSKEQSAKEREDLRVAKEMKKQARQNERDAWEGNLRSAIN